MFLAAVGCKVDQWGSQYPEGYWPPMEQYLRLVEEVGEVGRELNHLYGHKKRKNTEADGQLADELADIIFTVVCMANQEKIDLDAAWAKMIDKIYTRDADRFKRT